MSPFQLNQIIKSTLGVFFLLSVVTADSTELRYKETCNETALCPESLRCTFINATVGAQCLCPHPDHQEYFPETNNCGSFLDSPCTAETNTACLDPLAECIQTGVKFPHTCQCQNDTAVAADGTCQLSFAVSCSKYEPGPQENQNLPDSCDEKNGFYCKADSQGKFKCSCKNDIDIVEPHFQRCTRPAGVRCTKTEECGKFTECKMTPAKPWGTCQCSPGYGLWKGRCDN